MKSAARIRSHGSGLPPADAQVGLEQREPLRVQRVEPPREHRLEEPLLPAEVVVDRGEVHARLGGDHPARRAVVAVVEKQALGGVQDAAGGDLAGGRAGGGGGRDGRGGRHRTKVSNGRLNSSPEHAGVKRLLQARRDRPSARRSG